MKLTPLDIHHKEFKHSLRGYSEDEVDEFLDEVADEFERLFKENIDLAEKLEAAMERLHEFEQMEKTVHNTLVAAQKSAEEIEANALKEAEITRKDSELRAKEVIHTALTEKQKTQNEFMRIKQAETDFRKRLRALLDELMSRVLEVPVPEDIEAIMSEPTAFEDVTIPEPAGAAPEEAAPVAEPEPTAAPAVEEAAAPAEEAAPEPAPETSSEAPEAEPAPEPVAEAPAESAEELAVEEPPESGFVTSVHLGEIESPEDLADEPELEAGPGEFRVPTLDSLGEREDDLGIEEID